MKVSCIQLQMKFCDVQSNFVHAKELIHDTVIKEKPDVVVLPETWSTGYYPKEKLKSFCEADGAQSKKTFSLLAKKLNVNIVAGSVVNFKNGKVYNTAYVFNREGELVCEYDKTHLFTPMDEHKFFEYGTKAVTFELDNRKCGIAICYDIRFPEFVRTLALNGAEMLFVVSQWPLKRIEHLKTLSAARAIENQMFVAVCNSCSESDGVVFGGNSSVIDPWGNILATADDKEKVITSDCDFSLVSEIRNTINVFNDRKSELYII